MQVIKITPRGYCYGVVDALVMAKRAAQDPNLPRPIYVLGQIVHNRHAVNSLTEHGIVNLDGEQRLQLLEQIDQGTVIFTAHGVSPAVKERARQKGLTVLDATCPDVEKTHALIRDLVGKDYRIIYIGKKGHPEPEGAAGEAPGHVHLVENIEDVNALNVPDERLAVVTQTTLSRWDTDAVIAHIRQRYPRVEVYNEICMATQLRQEAAVAQAAQADVVIVVGDPKSNNSNRLVQVVREVAHKPAHLCPDLQSLDLDWLTGCRNVAVTAGSSTPTEVTRAVVQFLEAYEPAATPV